MLSLWALVSYDSHILVVQDCFRLCFLSIITVSNFTPTIGCTGLLLAQGLKKVS